MTWEALGRGSDNRHYYRDGNRWFSSDAAIADHTGTAAGATDDIASYASAHSDAVHSGGVMPESSWPEVSGWTRHYNAENGSCSYTRPGTGGGAEVSRSFTAGQQGAVRSDLATNAGVPPPAPGLSSPGSRPAYAPPGAGASVPTWFLNTPAYNRLVSAGIDPGAYLHATGGEGRTGGARTTYLNDIASRPPGEAGNAELRNRMAMGTADRWLDYYQAQGVEPSVAYDNLRARGVLSDSATPPARWAERRALTPADVPHGPGEGSASSMTTLSPQDCSANLADLENLRSTGLGPAAGRRDRVLDDTARIRMTNDWVDRMAAQPGWNRDSARAVLQHTEPPMLDANGRVTNFDINTGAHILYDIPESVRVDSTHPAEGPRLPPPGSAVRAPTMDGVALRPDRATPSVTSGTVYSPLTRAFLAARPTPPPAPSGDGAPTGVGGATGAPIPGAASGPGTISGPGGAPMALPPGVSGDSAFSSDFSWFLSTIPSMIGTGGATSGLPARFVSNGTLSASAPPAYGGTGPVVADISPAASGTPEATALSSEADRMRALGFNDAEITEYQRQSRNRLGRERTADEIGATFTAEGGGVIPESQRGAVLSETRAGMRTYMITETANGIRRLDPNVSPEDAQLMAEQLYRERAGTSGDASLTQMIEHRGHVADDLRYIGQAGHPERMTALRERTCVHEENAFYEAARGAVSPGSRTFYANNPAGRTNLRLYMVDRGGDGVFNSPSAIRRLRTDSGLGAGLDQFRTGSGATGSASRTALESRLSTAGGASASRPDFSVLPAGAERGRAQVDWQRREIEHGWQETSALRERTWRVEDRDLARAWAVEDRNFGAAMQYAMQLQNQRFQREQQNQQLAMNVANQFAQFGMGELSKASEACRALTQQQLQAMLAINQALIAQGTPKPFDIVMGMLQGGRR